MPDITDITQVKQIRHTLIKYPEQASIFEIMILICNYVINNMNTNQLLSSIEELLKG